MLKDIPTKIYRALNRYTFLARARDVLTHTPRHALHWYALVLGGTIVTMIYLVISWSLFMSVSASGEATPTQTGRVATIDLAKLTEALDTYRTRLEHFEQLKRHAPSVVDPGR